MTAVEAERDERRSVLRAAVGIGLYAGAFGASFGAVTVGSGLTLAQTMVLSLVMFSGASQYAFAGVAGEGGAPLAAVAAALLLAVRNGFYGVPLADILRPRGWARLGTAHFVIDETTAMALGQPTRALQRYAFWSTGLILCTLWQVGTLVGALAGAAVDPAVFGLDAAAPAVFLALLWPRLGSAQQRWVALAGVGAAVVALLLRRGFLVVFVVAITVTALLRLLT